MKVCLLLEQVVWVWRETWEPEYESTAKREHCFLQKEIRKVVAKLQRS